MAEIMENVYDAKSIEDYGQKDKSKRKTKDEKYKTHRRKGISEVKFRRAEKNYWPHKGHYYLYVVMLGNGPDFMPYMICFALEISGGFFIITYLLSAFLLAMPLIYMEIFLGRYTTLTNSQMYRMAPMFFGFGVMVLLMNMFYIPINMVQTSHFFIDFLKLMIEPDLFKQCPVGPENSTCFDNIVRNITKDSLICNHGNYTCPVYKDKKYVTEYIYWQTFKSDDPSNYPIWQLIISLIVTWIVIAAVLILGMRVIGAVRRN